MQEQETLVTKTQAGVIETQAGETETQAGDEQAELVEELLIEEISIDGMCGVY
ncbi:MAG TPA: mycofactocin precursor MftA [Ilumatobacter sp.]|jgi:mycofactocin precursor